MGNVGGDNTFILPTLLSHIALQVTIVLYVSCACQYVVELNHLGLIGFIRYTSPLLILFYFLCAKSLMDQKRNKTDRKKGEIPFPLSQSFNPQ